MSVLSRRVVCALPACLPLWFGENAENAENEITQTVATLATTTTTTTAAARYALYYREMFRNLKQVDLIRVHTQHRLPKFALLLIARGVGRGGITIGCYTLSISLYQLCSAGKWQHAQRVWRRKKWQRAEMKTQTKKRENEAIAQHGISIGSIFAYLPCWLPATCVCGCQCACVCVGATVCVCV